ncbi:nuclear transport factor 2 family protein [Ruminococcus sp.]|uniref:nuclear transport factor 2 family protein n=1 Tax=Ruminococcus sp. TaxID=41978 RepID=UPI0025DD92BD|nr:nuclear transport factor 2 family protein [Ruminococcus sp.]MBQ8967603.1 nuclear transport factor 2 family protein [Ruminococcus sp.]
MKALLLVLLLLLKGCTAEGGNTSLKLATTLESGDDMNYYDFSALTNVELINAELGSMTDEELAVLYAQARYCQAMTNGDIDTMRDLVSEDMTYTHMSGMTQTREEYFADIAGGSLRYFTIGMDSPTVEVSGDTASVTYTSVLNANAYGARGTFRMKGTHYCEKRNGEWIAVNSPE